MGFNEEEIKDLAVRIGAIDAGVLVIGPSQAEPKYKFLPTLAEAIAGYCIINNIKVPSKIKKYLSADSMDILGKKYSADTLKQFAIATLVGRGILDAERVGGYVTFQRPIYALQGENNREIIKYHINV